MRVDPDSPAGMGLLNYLSAHSLDDDYARVARRPGAGGSVAGTATRRRIGPATMVALAGFALLCVIAATQASQNAVANAGQSQALADQLIQRRAALAADRDHIDALTRETATLRSRLLSNENLSTTTRRQLADLGVAAGTTRVRGPGVVVVVDDASGSDSARNSVLDTDLQQLVNGLWAAGAEAIAINDQRLTNLSAIRQAGSAIGVNFASLDRPYTVRAIGDPATLPSRFAGTAGGQTWLDLQHQVGLQFSLHTSTSMTLPAGPDPSLRYATTKGDVS